MVRAYSWDDVPNFGDRLTPYLLKWYAGYDYVQWSPVEQADVIVVGSILEHVPPGWAGHVMGAGRLLEDSPLSLAAAKVHAVRGPLSAKGLGDVALGDPGLLADELAVIETRDIELGIVPHWSDTDIIHRHTFQPYNPVIISPWKDPGWVVSMIGRCKKIVSSSLHGIILADAFGIPRRTEMAARFRDDKREGDMFKFRDYNASVGVEFKVGETQQARRGIIEERKSELFDAFRELARDLR